MSDPVRVNRRVSIPADEIDLKFTTSSGPGGQHANKAATRVDLTWNVTASRALGPRQRERVKSRLRYRIDSQGNLRLSSARHRSQTRNRQDVLARLALLVEEALVPEKRRVATKPTTASKERRLQAKRRRSNVKRQRRPSFDD